jgi:hypothetical protein
MRRTILIGLALALFLAIAFGCGRQQAAPTLNVNEVGSDPAAFTGTITVTGVTAGFAAQDATLFGLMDKKELQCQTPNCKKLLIPVRYQGKLPALGDEVLVTGSFVDAGGGYLFAAQKIEVLRNHRLGG